MTLPSTIPDALDRPPSRWLRRISIAHVAVGLVLHRTAIRELLQAGLVGAVPDHGRRATAFWYFVAAPTLWLSGRLLQSAEDSADTDAQRAAGNVLVVTSAVGVAAMPTSGWWAILATGAASLRRGRRPSATTSS